MNAVHPYWYEGEPEPQRPHEAANDGFPGDKDVSVPPKGSDPAVKERDKLTASGDLTFGRRPDEKR